MKVSDNSSDKMEDILDNKSSDDKLNKFLVVYQDVECFLSPCNPISSWMCSSSCNTQVFLTPSVNDWPETTVSRLSKKIGGRI